MDELLEDSTLDMVKEAAEELAEDFGIIHYVNVFRYKIQYEIYEEKKFYSEFKPSVDLLLSRANLSGLDLSEMYLVEADLSWADLSGTNLSGASLSGTCLYRACLSGTNLSGADLSDADLSGTDLSGADLSGADLTEANLTGANLTKANFTNSIIKDTNFNYVKKINDAINLKIEKTRKNPNAKKKTKKKSIKRR